MKKLKDMERIGMEDVIRRAQNLIQVRHQDLPRADDESIYRSKCPSCNGGLLLLRRDQITLNIMVTDLCIQCGQAVEYSDIVPGLKYLKYKETNDG